MGALVVIFAPLFAIAAPFQLIAGFLETSLGNLSDIISLWSTYFA